MDFSFTQEQLLLSASVRRFLATRYSFEARRDIIRSETGASPGIWKSFADELGLLGALTPIEFGGLGGGPVEMMLIMDAFGEAMVVEPFLETIVVGAHALLASRSERHDALLQKLISGEALVSIAGIVQNLETGVTASVKAARDGDHWVLNGVASVVMAAPLADHLIVAANTGMENLSLFLVDPGAPGVTRRNTRTIDARRAADITIANLRVSEDALLGQAGEARGLIEALLDRATAAICAEAVGGMRRLVADTVAFTKQRKQFGKAISEFQVLQHRMVDMHIAVELAEAATLLAILNLDSPPSMRARAISAAKATIAEKARFVGQAAVQTHGGMGMTDDIAVGHIFKRLTAIEHEFGSRDRHVARYRRLMEASA